MTGSDKLTEIKISQADAELLLQCYVNESVRRYGHFKETSLAKKLDEIANKRS